MVRIDKGREGVIRGDLKLWFDHGCFRFYDTKPTGAAPKFVHGNENASPANTAARPMVDPLGE
jgi:hypothetical protein